MSRTTHRISVVLRGGGDAGDDDDPPPTLSQLRTYVGDIYSSAWDITLGFDRDEDDDDDDEDDGYDDEDDDDDDASSGMDGTRTRTRTDHHPSSLAQSLLDVIVYPQNLPNAAPEGWVVLRPDLDCICSHDSLTGWSSAGGSGTGTARLQIFGQGVGGLDDEVEAINADRTYRGLGTVDALNVDPWPVGADVTDDAHVVFLKDSASVNRRRWRRAAARGGDKKGEVDEIPFHTYIYSTLNIYFI
jgi:hypothetical protein